MLLLFERSWVVSSGFGGGFCKGFVTVAHRWSQKLGETERSRTTSGSAILRHHTCSSHLAKIVVMRGLTQIETWITYFSGWSSTKVRTSGTSATPYLGDGGEAIGHVRELQAHGW